MGMDILPGEHWQNIVHTHAVAGPITPQARGCVLLVHPSHDPAQLEVMEIEPTQIRAGNLYRVNPQSKKTEMSKKEGASSTASARQEVAPSPANR
jgi:hypothetical protein